MGIIELVIIGAVWGLLVKLAWAGEDCGVH